MRTKSKLMTLGAILALGLAGVAMGAGGGERFAEGSDRGQSPLASATGVAEKPKVIYAKITTRPSGSRVGAKYSTECAKGASAGTRGDEFVGRTPVRKRLRMRFDRPDVCSARILARAEKHGYLRVVLRAR
jgi:hypothetical protein